MKNSYTQTDTEDLLQILQVHRVTLAHVQRQAAEFTPTYVPPHIASQIREALEQIEDIQRELAKRNVDPQLYLQRPPTANIAYPSMSSQAWSQPPYLSQQPNSIPVTSQQQPQQAPPSGWVSIYWLRVNMVLMAMFWLVVISGAIWGALDERPTTSNTPVAIKFISGGFAGGIIAGLFLVGFRLLNRSIKYQHKGHGLLIICMWSPILFFLLYGVFSAKNFRDGLVGILGALFSGLVIASILVNSIIRLRKII